MAIGPFSSKLLINLLISESISSLVVIISIRPISLAVTALNLSAVRKNLLAFFSDIALITYGLIVEGAKPNLVSERQNCAFSVAIATSQQATNPTPPP